MSTTTVRFSETGEERQVTSGCFVCSVSPEDVAGRYVIVSPTGKAHHGGEYGKTYCGKDATGPDWWWPL